MDKLIEIKLEKYTLEVTIGTALDIYKQVVEQLGKHLIEDKNLIKDIENKTV